MNTWPDRNTQQLAWHNKLLQCHISSKTFFKRQLDTSIVSEHILTLCSNSSYASSTSGWQPLSLPITKTDFIICATTAAWISDCTCSLYRDVSRYKILVEISLVLEIFDVISEIASVNAVRANLLASGSTARFLVCSWQASFFACSFSGKPSLWPCTDQVSTVLDMILAKQISSWKLFSSPLSKRRWVES